jgi:RNA polymerase-binding transcription factor DksA
MDAARALELLTTDQERLLRVRAGLLADRAGDAPEGDASGDLTRIDQHQADIASEVFEREKDLSVLARVTADLADTSAALRRLDRGVYGRCEACGRRIDDRRLAAMPATRFCVGHQGLWEGARLAFIDALPEPSPGAPAVPIEQLVELMATFSFGDLPHDDEPEERLRVGPEEAALHAVRGDRDRGQPLSPAEIEAAEARYAEERWNDEHQSADLDGDDQGWDLDPELIDDEVARRER